MIDGPALRTRKTRMIERVYTTTETGYLNISAMKFILDQFITWWCGRCGTRDVYLLSDNLAIHNNPDLVLYCLKRRVFLWSLVPGTSYWLQVHDNTPFGSLKRFFGDFIHKTDFHWDDDTKTRKKLLAGCFFKAEEKAFQLNNLKHAFNAVGLWPFQPDLIRDRAKQEYRQTEDQMIEDLTKRISDGLKKVKEHEDAKREAIMAQTEPKKAIFVGDYDFSPMKKVRKVLKPNEIKDLPKVCECFTPTNIIQTLESSEPIAVGAQCDEVGCQHKHRKSKQWVFCKGCGKVWCPKHKSSFKLHACTLDKL